MILKQRTMQPIRKLTKLLHKQNLKVQTVANQVKQTQLLAIQQFSTYWIYQRMNRAKRIAYWIYLIMQQIVVDQIMHPHNRPHQIYWDLIF